MSHQQHVEIPFFLTLTQQEILNFGNILFKDVFSLKIQDTLQNLKHKIPPELEVTVCIFFP